MKWKARRSSAPRYQCHVVYFSNESLNATSFLLFCNSEYMKVHIFDFFAKIQSTVTWRLRTRLGDETTWVGKLWNPGKRDNFLSCKHFGSPNQDNSRHGECHEIPRLKVWSKHLKQRREINSAQPTVIEWSRETQGKRDICRLDSRTRNVVCITAMINHIFISPYILFWKNCSINSR